MRCRKEWSFTAGTFFHRMKNATLWLGAIWLSEHGIKASASEFCTLAGTAYSSAWTMFQKLALVVDSEESAPCERVSSSLFSELIGKRSRETLARAHPVAEEEVVGADTTEAADKITDSELQPEPAEAKSNSNGADPTDTAIPFSGVKQTVA